MCPQGSKIWFKNHFWGLEAYFWPPRAQMASIFRFCVWFLISDKRQSVWYITRRIFCANLENRIFLPRFTVLPISMKYSTAAKRAVGESNGNFFRLLWGKLYRIHYIFFQICAYKFYYEKFFEKIQKFSNFVIFSNFTMQYLLNQCNRPISNFLANRSSRICC